MRCTNLALALVAPFVVAATALPLLGQARPTQFDWHAQADDHEKIGAAADPVLDSARPASPEALARIYLRRLAVIPALKQASSDAVLDRILTHQQNVKDLGGDTTAVFSQHYRGVPVYGSDVRVHLREGGGLRALTVKLMPALDVSTLAEISPAQAVEISREHSDQPNALRRVRVNAPRLYVYVDDGGDHLAWVVTLPGVDYSTEGRPAMWKYFIDAHDGAVLRRFNDLKFQESAEGTGVGLSGPKAPLFTSRVGEARFVLEDISHAGVEIRTYDFEHRDIQFAVDSLPGEMHEDEDNAWDRPDQRQAVDAHFNAKRVFEYFLNEHGRFSLDDQGMDLVSSLHGAYWRVALTGGDPKKWNNAVWYEGQMVYGDGDGVTFSPLVGALDIVAHEFTHGVIEYSADLEYSGQPGALNESIADLFGAMVDNDDWLLGEDVFTPSTAGDALRSLQEPSLFGQPDHMADFVVTDKDNGGVHTNSGIINRAGFLIAVGGEQNGIVVNGVGREATAALFYLALTKYLSVLSDFEDARRQMIKACHDIFPGDHSTLKTVLNAFAAVGIGEPSDPGGGQ